MRFSHALAACTLLLVPLHGAAQETEPPADTAEADEAAEAEPAAPPSVSPAEAFAEDGACPREMTSARAARFGEPSAQLDPAQAVYTPAGLSVLDSPVAYVIVGRQAGANGAVVRLTYRFAGVNSAWGGDYRAELRHAFDAAFGADFCGEAGATCILAYRNPQPRGLADTELSTRMPAIPQGATGEAMPLLKADYDLEGADPVFLVCNYRP